MRNRPKTSELLLLVPLTLYGLRKGPFPGKKIERNISDAAQVSLRIKWMSYLIGP